MRRSLIGTGLALLLLGAVPGSALGFFVDLQFGSARIDRAAGELVISGTYTCDVGTTGDITAIVTQGGGAEAGGTTVMECTDAQMTWEIRSPLGTPPVHPGPAILDFGFSASDGTTGGASGQSIEITVDPR